HRPVVLVGIGGLHRLAGFQSEAAVLVRRTNERGLGRGAEIERRLGRNLFWIPRRRILDRLRSVLLGESGRRAEQRRGENDQAHVSPRNPRYRPAAARTECRRRRGLSPSYARG